MATILPYTETYKDEVIHLILQVYESELHFVGYERPDIYDVSGTYQKSDRSNFWIALENNELVGTAAIFEKTTDIAYLKRMIVRKDYRKQGLGRELLDTALSFAKENGYKTVYAGTVLENPNAIAFYKRNGFVEEQPAPIDITASGDSICLKKSL
ncbi:MAG: GNAT family N-acetyltransferase [Candidatus Magasanikbacteria bacterium CG11_big_fil_rev_8_21_14_0_20_39_34]|uniref:GNAT family N-acetyltransferase n=1 Tax=Candidatus Magasanikbacteria bacterium CG11_big_fil_rev_8_21_14_0_20_39_34 TaxID=1974653 RepID=A0A2H0N5L9_9BACT|nr:MAG: GNAT family N-acetyltransferase [Candidatus Magasanikbacteria bacterium CG11_big_fil_rev_8_21_14_0_20_39_34]